MSCEVLSEKIVTTRKAHFCFACGRDFPAGTKMTHQSNVIDGDFSSIHVCETCNDLMKKEHDVLFDDFDGVFPEFCVRYALPDSGYKTPEEWLRKSS